jgi:hypothetical protein
MNGHFSFNKIVAFLLPLFFVGLIFMSSCEEKEKIVTEIVTDTVEVEVVVEIISVDEIYADPDSIAQGGSITLTADVTADEMAGELKYHWFADAGSFDKTEGDTVTWKAPDDPGVYEVRVHVTDNVFIAIGNEPIGVGMYAPTVTPYFVGGQGDACASCHSGAVALWEETGHAHAWAGLQESGHAASYCNPCHTIGYTDNPGDSGYDEAPIAKFEDVQCESCHGPASEHPGNPGGGTIEVSYAAENCGQCHEGTHHPYLTEWEESPHNFGAESAHGAPVNGGCQGCHEGVASAERLSGDLSEFYGGAPYGSPPRDTLDHPVAGIVCSTCHEPHDATNMGQLRTVADVPLVTANDESPIITDGGTGKLCMHCHHARRGPEKQIAEGYDHFGPHANPQADMMAGKSASHGVAPQDFVWARPVHINVVNSCKTCHLPMAEYVSEAEPAKTGHTFEPKVEACEPCHGVLADFDDIRANDDWDGNGQIEGVQTEINGLLHTLEMALYESGLDTTGGASIEDALGDTTRSTVAQRTAGYNLVFVEDDKSHGIHNPFYCAQLLQQSIIYLNPGKIPNAAIVRDEHYAAVR